VAAASYYFLMLRYKTDMSAPLMTEPRTNE
jgi:hypothetical protein